MTDEKKPYVLKDPYRILRKFIDWQLSIDGEMYKALQREIDEDKQRRTHGEVHNR